MNQQNPETTKRDSDLDLTQIVAGALAAVSAAVAASYFGVGGTLAGAALGSVVGTVGTAFYKRSLTKTNEKLRETIVPIQTVVLRRQGDTVETDTFAGGTEAPAHPAATTGDTAPAPTDLPGEPADTRATAAAPAPPHHRVRVAAFAVVAFVLALGAVTAAEAVAGRPLSSLLTGHRGTGTTLQHVTGGGAAVRTNPAPTTSAGPSPTATPTATPSSSASASSPAPAPGGASASPPAVPLLPPASPSP
ncbi:MAG TPA: hypothetical protein VGD72_02765 [Mycobacteriales bacterium]|jgi:hypothetical protein